MTTENIRAQPPAREVPVINIKCEADVATAIGTTSLNVIRVEREDDGSLTAVTDHWPPAREDAQPVAWRVGDDGAVYTTLKAAKAHVGGWRRQGMTCCDPQPLYTHPAPDALREAVEALESVKRHSVLGSVNFNTAVDALKALAALQAEQGAK